MLNVVDGFMRITRDKSKVQHCFMELAMDDKIQSNLGRQLTRGVVTAHSAQCTRDANLRMLLNVNV